jgi:hypothetical protein
MILPHRWLMEWQHPNGGEFRKSKCVIQMDILLTKISISPPLITDSVWSLVTQPWITRSHIYAVLQMLHTATILFHIITSTGHTVLHNLYIWRSLSKRHIVSFRTSVFYLTHIKTWFISLTLSFSKDSPRDGWLRCMWLNSMYIDLNQPLILVCILGIVDRSANSQH